MRRLAKISLITACLSSLYGCATATAGHDMLPPSRYATVTSGSSNIEIYRDGERPNRPTYRIANIGAHGNGYANTKSLENAMLKEARKVNADCVVVVGANTTKDETIGSYSGGIYMADQIQRPHLYGIALKYSKVQLGINADKEGTVSYVTADSSAEKAGIQEGMKILAINGTAYGSDAYTIEKEVSVKNPGDKVTIEVFTKDGQKLRKEIILEPPKG